METIGLGNIRVVLVPDGEYIFAQGLEVDYAAQGETATEAMHNFKVGLEATIQQHLKVHGNVRRLLRPASAAIWQELIPCENASDISARYMVATDTLENSALPYGGIIYFTRNGVAK